MNLSMVTVQCYIQDKEKVLLLHRVKKHKDPHEGKWVGIGGHVEKSETPNEAILREIKEEAGIVPENLKLKGVITFPNFANNDTDEVMFLYTADGYTGNIIECNEGNLEWFNKDEIQDLNMWAGDRIYFEWMKENRFFIGKLRYDGEKVVESNVKYM